MIIITVASSTMYLTIYARYQGTQGVDIHWTRRRVKYQHRELLVSHTRHPESMSPRVERF